MFHKSELGRFARHVDKFTDQHGYVPERGDDWRDMGYDVGEADEVYLDEKWWPSILRGAVALTDEIRELQEQV